MTGTDWALGALGAGLPGGIGAVLGGRMASRERPHPRPA